MIGGNTKLTLQLKITTENAIGESVENWVNVVTFTGWLDYQSGDSPRTAFKSKIEQSTHFFICDYVDLSDNMVFSTLSEENARAIVDGKVYDVLIIDNPMRKNRQYEIYLKYTGGQI